MPTTAAPPKPERLVLRERVEAFEPGKPPVLDRDKGIVRDVKVLGRTSRNGKTYSDRALDDACRLFEQMVVYTNHPPKEFAGRRVPRALEDRFGRLSGLHKTPDGVYAREMRYNTGHPLAESFAWNVENDPKGIGLSINGHTNRFTRQSNGTVLVEGIDEAFSVDLVDGPATGEGLFEQDLGASMDPETPLTDPAAPVDDVTPVEDPGSGDHKDHIVNAISAIADELRSGSLSHAEAKTRVAGLLKMLEAEDKGEDDKPAPAELPDEMPDDEAEKVVEQLRAGPTRATRWAGRRIASVALRERFEARRARAAKAVPALALTEQFLADLRDAPTEALADARIADRAKVARTGPRSAPPAAGAPERTLADIKAFLVK